MATTRGVPAPRLSGLLGAPKTHTTDALGFVLGCVLIVTLVLAIQIALGLVFDPRYKDFPFAPLTAAIVPLASLSFAVKRPAGARGAAEVAGAVMLSLSVLYILPNEGMANWQSLWLCAVLALFAVTLLRVRDAQG
jgi:glucan 1,3-beta-glucosidase